MRPLAIIEPDPPRRAELRAAVEAAGFRADCFSTATSAIPHLRERAYALALLGLDSCDTDPYALCRDMSPRLPVIAIAADCSTETCVRALECGADDCVIHATSARELVARIRGVLRRSARPGARESLVASVSEMRVHVEGMTRDLTRGETELLSLLLQHSPTPLPIARLTTLLDARRGTVESRIKSLRRKLGPGRLVSRGSLGYELVAE